MRYVGGCALLFGMLVISLGQLGAKAPNLRETVGGWSIAKFTNSCAASINAPDGTHIGFHGRRQRPLTLMLSNSNWQWSKWREQYAVTIQFFSDDGPIERISLTAEGSFVGEPGLIMPLPNELSDQKLSRADTMKLSREQGGIGSYQLYNTGEMLSWLRQCVDGTASPTNAPS